jgi:outer membrane protein insertion porin family
MKRRRSTGEQMNRFCRSWKGSRLKIGLVCAALFVFWGGEVGFATTSPVPGETISQIEIVILQGKGETGLWETIARNLIQLDLQQEYEPDRISQAIVRLSTANLFESIHVPDPVKTPGGVHLRFELVPKGRIKDIRISNAFPLFDREVLNAMTLSNGDAFSEEILGEQEERVINLFKKQGFIDPKVALSARKDEMDGNYVLSVQIDKGDFLRVNRVNIKGNARISSSRLKLRTKTWKASVLFGSASRFVQKDLDEDVKNFTAFYREKGFADVSVSAEVRDISQKQVDLTFFVQEGPQYQVVFEGNDQFWAYTLNKEMTLERDGNKNDFALGKSIRNLEKKYAQKGYPDARITTVVKETAPPDAMKQVTLAIHEGDEYRVEGIHISGNHVVSDQEIFDNMLTRLPSFGNPGAYVPKILDEDMNAIRSLYLKQGFTRTRVHKDVRVQAAPGPDRKSLKLVEISLAIDEGVQTQVGQVLFDGLSVFPAEKALEWVSLKPGQPFRDYMIKDDETLLKQKISEQGYPNVQVSTTRKFNPDRTRINLIYATDQGPMVRMGQVYYMGNFRTKAAIFDTELEMAPGAPLSLAKLLESRRNMMNLNAIDSVRFRTIGLKNKDPEVDVIVEVDEKKPYYFEMGTGYDTQRHLYLNSTVGDHNFWGQNLDLKLAGEISQIGYNGNLTLLEPRFLSTQIRGTTRIFGEKQEEFNKDFGIESTGVSQDFSRKFLSNKLTVNLGLKYEFRNQYLTQDRELTVDETADYEQRQILMASPGIVFQTTDSYVRPRKGTLCLFNVDVSKGIDNTVDDYIQYRLDTRFYYTVFEPLVIALRGTYGVSQPYGNNGRVAEDQLFFLGGTSSVRGFGENLLAYDAAGKAVGGREGILGSIEARYDLGLNFEAAAFYDTGSVRKTQGKSGSDGFRDSVGLGLRYMTPIGPIGLLYGWKLDPRPDESSGSFHFSMGYTF